jgi:hypothetical protein
MCDGAELLVKFVGLGPRGRMAYERAERVAGAGFAPAPLVLAHGFLAAQVVRGTPLGGEALGDTNLERVSTYLACVAREFPAGGEAEPGPLAEMLECNVAEVLGADARRCVARLASEPALRDAAAVALDARMLAHEWLRVGVGLVKTDATDHHDDHFFPGPGDLAWDVAGAAVELDLAPAAVRRLVERVAALSGDASLARRVPFHTAVYAAFRLGYAMLAADALRGSEEEPRWRALVPRYRDVLRQALARGAHAA